MYRGKELPKTNALGLPLNWYGLADGNSFYCSCEVANKPWLEGRPVIVASNGDRIAIAMNREAKALGIKMGDFLFEKVKEISENKICVFSSNYEEYGFISGNMHTSLGSFVEEIQVESIDESFLKFTGFDKYDLEQYGYEIIRTQKYGLGIPISLGIAQTKTLAKAANKLAKSDKQRKGLYIIATEEERIEALRKLPLKSVWGIGRQNHEKLKKDLRSETPTAYDFATMYQKRVRKLLGVTGERTYLELNGIECIPFQTTIDDKERISTTRMFTEAATEYDEVFAAIVKYLSACVRKLRRQNSYAQSVYVFFHTSLHPDYKGLKDTRGLEVHFPSPLKTMVQILPYVTTMMKALWPEYKPGEQPFRYKKAGIVLNGVIPDTSRQMYMNDDPEKLEKLELLQKAIDKINGDNNMDNPIVMVGGQFTLKDKGTFTRAMKTDNPQTKWEDRFMIRNT